MKIRLFLFILLAAFLLGACTPAHASQSSIAQPSAEEVLLEKVFALQGLDLSEDARESKLDDALHVYASTAPTDGRQERLEAALIRMGIFNPAQAENFVSQSTASEANVRNVQASKPDQTQAVLAQEIESLASLQLNGAQFSACVAGEAAVGVGLALAYAGWALFEDNPTCSSQLLSTWRTCTNGTDCVTHHTVSTTCAQPDYYPHRSLGSGLLIGGGVAVAVGALVLYVSQQTCF